MNSPVPKCFQLVGVPASGKTTWIKKQVWALGCHVVSTDFWVELEASRLGKTYSEIFAEYMPTAVKLMAANVVAIREMGNDIIWDQTSSTIASRAKKFRMLPDYEHIAVVFETPDKAELSRRLQSRPGKIIPWEVIQDMIDNFEYPTCEEGFKEIWRFDSKFREFF
jgi:predicted kinase